MLKIKRTLLFFLVALTSSYGLGVWYFSEQIISPKKVTLDDYTPIHPDERRDPGQLGLTFENVTVNVKGNNCYGWYIPASSPTRNLVVLVHGRGDNRRRMLKYAPFLHQAGYPVFLMDQRHAGTSYNAPCSMGYYESQELIAACRQLELLHPYSHLALMGHSMGAATIALAQPYLPKTYTMILDCPYPSFREVITDTAHRDYPWMPSFFIRHVLLLTGWRLGFNVDAVDLKRCLMASHIPLLIIHTGKDDIMKVSYAPKLITASAAPDKVIWFVPDAGHVRSYLRSPQLFKEKILTRLRTH